MSVESGSVEASPEASNIESSIEEIDEITRRATISIPVDDVNREFDVAIVNLTKTAKIKGFRPGKAPRQMIEKLHGKRVHFEIANRLISESLNGVVKENKLEVIGQPEIEISSFEPGEEIKFTANISLFPRPKITGYEKFEVEVPKEEVSDESVQEVVDNFLTSKANMTVVEGRTVVEEKDVVDAAVEVIVDGEEPQRPEPLVVALGEGRLPDELEAGLIGMEVGAEKEITVTLPEDHPNQELRGNEVLYKVTLNSISTKELPELTDDFVKSLNSDVETVLELKLDIRKRLEDEQERSTKDALHEKLLEVLLDGNEFKVPDALVDDEIRNLIMSSGMVDQEKINPEQIDVTAFRERLGDMALKRVRTAIIVDRISEHENLKAEEEDINAYIEDVAQKNGLSTEEVKQYFMGKDRLFSTLLEVTRNKVLAFLSERSKVKYVKPEKEESKEKETKKAPKKAKKKAEKAEKAEKKE